MNALNPPEVNPLFCFSNESTLKLFQVLYPEKAESFISLRELVTKLGSRLPTEKEHELAFTSLIPSHISLSDEEIKQYYLTVQTLRESLILKEEHLEHCFTLLPQSKKNSTLKAITQSYLNSPLSHDLAEAVWQLLGSLREKKRSIDFPLLMVKEPTNSFLFTELSEILPSIETWQVNASETSEGKLFFGSNSESLLGFTENIKKWNLSKTSGQTLWIPFHGNEKERQYLQFFLNSEKILFHSFFESKEIEPLSEFSLTLEHLRKNKSLPLKERLEQNQALLLKKQEPAVKGVALLSQQTNAAKVKPHLLQHLLQPLAYLFPFQVVAPSSTSTVIGFCNSTFLSGDSFNLLFTEGELEALYQGGFPLPRRSKIIEHRKSTLNETQNQNNLVYTSLSRQNVSLSFESTPVSISHLSQENIEDYKVTLKINRLSATQLETYSQCPAKYFFLNRLRMRAPLSFKDSYALVLGQTVHLALENACKTKFPFTLDELNTHYEAALKEYLPEGESSNSHRTILTSQFKLLADRVMTLENTLNEQFGVGTPLLIEDSFELDIEGLKFTGKIDRVDLRNGKIVILDYKTGNVDFTPEHIRKGSNFQALLYILAMEKKLKEPLSGMLFYDLKQGELKRGLLIEEEVSKETKKSVTRGHTLSVEKFEGLKADGINQIKLLAEKMNSGNFEPVPSTDCNYCEARGMCRKAYGYV